MSCPVDIAVSAAVRLIEASNNGHTRPVGQRFTTPEVARFMAQQIRRFPPSIRILDAGAGVGILAAAVCERIARLKRKRLVFIEAWETDQRTRVDLESVLTQCKEQLRASGHECSYSIRADDFVLDQSSDLEAGVFYPSSSQPVDVAIINPPYFKLKSGSSHARAMQRFYAGQPNMYAAFMALCALRLADDGIMAAITPRSFCNGLYFRNFREFLRACVSPAKFHVFHSRSKTFAHERVLQEIVISVATKSQNPTVQISSSECGRFSPLDTIEVSCEQIISPKDPEGIIRLPATSQDVHILEAFDALSDTFDSLGFAISTGPVVDFRCRSKLVAEPDGLTTVPLLWMHNVKPPGIRWPLERNGKSQYILDDAETDWMLVPDSNYVLLKRFSAKEEKRRLVAGFLETRHLGHERIGIENHLNFIYGKDKPLSRILAIGLCRWFNSSLLDQYFRIINGNTQVNATEIRVMPVPPLDFFRRLGKRAMDDPTIKRELLGSRGSLAAC